MEAITQNATSILLVILQLVAVFYAVVVGFRLIFGVSLNEDGNPQATKPHGVFLLKGIGASLRGTKKVIDGATNTVKKVITPATKVKRPMVLNVWGKKGA